MNINGQVINDWVEEETKNKIKNLIKPEFLSQDTNLILVNAIYFKADWKYKFDKKKTEEKNFYVEGGNPQKAPTMYLSGSNFKVADMSDLKSKMLRLPYKGDRIVLDILLPDAKENGGYVSVGEVEKTLEEKGEGLKEEFEKRKSVYEVLVTLPKFKVESTHSDLDKALKASGLTEMWCEGGGQPDFSGIGANLCVSKVRFEKLTAARR